MALPTAVLLECAIAVGGRPHTACLWVSNGPRPGGPLTAGLFFARNQPVCFDSCLCRRALLRFPTQPPKKRGEGSAMPEGGNINVEIAHHLGEHEEKHKEASTIEHWM